MVQASSDRVNRWVIAQRWSHVSFLSFRCKAELIRGVVPPSLEIDVFDGDGVDLILDFLTGVADLLQQRAVRVR